MKKWNKFVLTALCLCMTILLCACGQEEKPNNFFDKIQEIEKKPTTESTTEPATEPATEPLPVYEKQTVYLCVQEKMHNYEGGDFLKGYTYDEYGRKTEYFGINADGTRSWVTEYSYDEKGNLIEERTGDSVNVMTYDEEGRILSKVSYYKDEKGNETYYEYDDQGYVIAETRIERYSEEITYTFDITYNEDHTEATIEQFRNGEPNGVTEETYNAVGQVLRSTVRDANGNWKRSQSWEYDAAGNLLQEDNYSSSETQADYMTIYTYDENGLLVSKNVDYYYGYLLEFTYEPFEILVRVN